MEDEDTPPTVRCNESPDDHLYFYLLSRHARLLIYSLETDSPQSSNPLRSSIYFLVPIPNISFNIASALMASICPFPCRII